MNPLARFRKCQWLFGRALTGHNPAEIRYRAARLWEAWLYMPDELRPPWHDIDRFRRITGN